MRIYKFIRKLYPARFLVTNFKTEEKETITPPLSFYRVEEIGLVVRTIYRLFLPFTVCRRPVCTFRLKLISEDYVKPPYGILRSSSSRCSNTEDKVVSLSVTEFTLNVKIGPFCISVIVKRGA